MSDSEEIIISEEGQNELDEAPFEAAGKKDKLEDKTLMKKKDEFMQPWQIDPKKEYVKADLMRSQNFVCLSAFTYAKALYDERKLYPLFEET